MPALHILLLAWFLSSLALARAEAVNVTVDDASGQISFHPSAATQVNWTTDQTSVHSYNNTQTQTSAPGAAFSFQFTGSAVYVVGSDWMFTRPFAANIDGNMVAVNVTGSNNKLELTSTPYWGVSNLTADEQHLLVVTTMDADDGSLFILDALIYTEEKADSTNSTSSVGTTSSKPSTSAILGGTIGGAGALSLALFLSIKFKINIIGNLHLGTWRPFSGRKTKKTEKPIDVEAALSGSAKEKKQLFRPEDEAIGDGHDRSDEDENDESEGDGYSEEETNGGEEDEDALDSDNDVDDNEDTNAPKHNGDAPKFILRTAPAPKRRSPALHPKSTGSRPSTPGRLSPQVDIARPRRNDDGRASPTTRPIAYAGRSSRPSSPSSTTGRSIRVSNSTAGSNLRYSSYEDEPLMSAGGKQTTTQGRVRRHGKR